MTPPNLPDNPTFEQKRDGEIRTLFEKARTHKNFQDARKSAQEITTVTVLGESDEEEQVEIIFKEHYASAKYTTDKEKPTIEEGKTHMLLGNVDSDAFDSNYDYGPDYYQDLKFNAELFTELKDYIDINFPPLKDPTKKARMLEMIDKTRSLGNALNIKSFKEFCTQQGFTWAEVFGKHGLLQVLLAFSRAIEPVGNRNLLKVENFKITGENPNPLFYRIELGVGKSGKNKKDRFSIVLKTTLSGETVEPDEEPEESDPDDEGNGTYVPGDIDKLGAPSDDEEEPDAPAQPTEPPAPPDTPPAQPTTPPVDPAIPHSDPDAPPVPATPPSATEKPADTPAPDTVLTTKQLDIKIDDVDTKLETNAPDGFTYEIAKITDDSKNYKIEVYFTDPKRPGDPAKTGIISFGKNSDYETETSNPGPKFWYNFSNTPNTASHLDIWKFYKLETDPANPKITITKLTTQIAAPSINYNEAEKTITIFPVADIGKRKVYTIVDQPDQNLKFEYFNEDGRQFLQVTTADGKLTGELNIKKDNTKPIISASYAADYPTDIFQHYDFAFTEGPGTTHGTLKITKKPTDIKKTIHEAEIALDSNKPEEKTKFTLTIKAPGNQNIEIDKMDKNNYYKVQFGGLTGFFKIEERDDPSDFVIIFQNYPDSDQPNETASSTQDLWSNYKATLDFDKKAITIEKLEKKPLPRLEYDEKTSIATFYEQDGDNEKATSYKINKPDDVKVSYQNENGHYYLELTKGDLMAWIKSNKSLLLPDTTTSRLSDTHDISFDENSDPKTITIAKKAPVVAPPPTPAPAPPTPAPLTPAPAPPAPPPTLGTATLSSVAPGSAPTVATEAKPDKITVSDAKDKITVTLDNGYEHDFTLILPKNYKDKIKFETKRNPNNNNKPYLVVYYDDNNIQYQGYINLPDNITALRDLNKYIGNWPSGDQEIKPFFSNDQYQEAPFRFKFEKGEKESPSTITIISNKEVEAIATKAKELKPFLEIVNKIYSTDFNIDKANCDATLTEINVNEFITNLSQAITELDKNQKTALTKIRISLAPETQKTNDNTYLTYKEINVPKIKEELIKAIEFNFFTASKAIINELKSKQRFPYQGNIRNDTWYTVKEHGEAREGDFKIEIEREKRTQKSTTRDPSWYWPWGGKKESSYTYEVTRVKNVWKYRERKWVEVIGMESQFPSIEDPQEIAEKSPRGENWWNHYLTYW